MSTGSERFDALIAQVGENLESAIPGEYQGRVKDYINGRFDNVSLSGKDLLRLLFAQQTLNLSLLEALVPIIEGDKDQARIQILSLVEEVRSQMDFFSDTLSHLLTEGLSAHLRGGVE